jgi:hypothetical protein
MRSIILLWVCFCAYFSLAGWTLSALHQLNRAGYLMVSLIGLVVVLIWRRQSSWKMAPQIYLQKLSRRFRRPIPAVYLFVAALTFLGGTLYAPDNYDALTYRLPRMLNWLAAGHWTWIPTTNDRMNYSGAAWEWTAMPLLALLRSDGGFFLINALGFLLMPGLLFSIFRQLGVARRVAWIWMWILPLAYGYATQAGSIGNDFTGTLFVLISVCFGLRARRSQDVRDVWIAVLAAALVTATKISNLPLLLPCLVALWPALPQLRERWISSLAVLGVAVLVSAAPTLALNQLNTGSWNGDPKNRGQMQIKSPAAALLGNSLLLLQQSFMPPVLPGAHKTSDWLDEKMPGSWRRMLEEKFPRYSKNRLNELPQEENAGLGLGITSLLLAGILAAIFSLIWKRSIPKISSVGLAAWISVLFFMSKMGSEATSRLLLPYYPLAIVPVLLLPVQERLSRLRVWKTLAVIAALSVLPAVILSPARPLFPAVSVADWLLQYYPDKPAAQRTAAVYLAYAHRNDALAPLRAGLPTGVLKIGFLAGENDTDYSLWRPFGLRRVEYLQSGADPSIKVPDNVEWLVVKRAGWQEATHVPLETWAAQHDAKITLSIPIVTLVSWGEQTWCVLHIEKP